MEPIPGSRFRGTWKYVRAAVFIGFFLAIFAFAALGSFLLFAKIEGAPPVAVPQTTTFYAADGSKIGESDHGQKRYWVHLDDISPYVIEATIAVEDRKFYEHHGFDLKRIAGAVLVNIEAMDKVQGASTITQQYARNLFLTHEKTWSRKIQEALYTIRLEANYSKDQILEGYLNTIYYGHGAYGIEAAARYYFGKHASELTLSEAAMLAGIPKGPYYYSPFVNEQRAKARQKIVLTSMVEAGYISRQEAEQAYRDKLVYVRHREREQPVAPYFQDVVKQQLRTKLGLDERTIELGGLRVYTTLDRRLQRIAEEQISRIIDPHSAIQAALVAMDPRTGEVKALVGGRNYEESPFNRAVQAERQPGSTFKPFLYYAAIEQGFTPSTQLRSELTTFTFNGGRSSYTPHNYNDYYANGPITLAEALAVSDNVFAVKTLQFIGADKLVETAKALGITSRLKAVPSLALGTSPVKVIDMVAAYSTLANYGKQTDPVFIKKVVDASGNVLYEHKPESRQVLDRDAAFVTTHLMTGMFDPKLNGYTTVTGQSIIDDITRPYAGKSGTTKTDSWMIGFAPQLVAGVWTGYDRGETMDRPAERQYAKQIWVHFMEQSLAGEPKKSFKPTKGVIGVYIDPQNGKLATDSCPVKRKTYYLIGTEPTDYCTDHLEKKKKKQEDGKSWFEKWFPWF
ncbi:MULTISPECIES: transglycosylase domain-containing protein [Geobacillus]|uniref:Monofunctional biosynthetic peptidoglycan transglycosylase n=1 Tax=Geobacillus thermocatenulatus TaxID=33938 RepID=A0A226Q8E1_9BACL|nr:MULTISPECIES: PBP1A family penicillin-binding protein [Geobacillus]ASS97922.1 monofunctional biosynthetic peptidoglycan transglycosylase [Geobacillus thermocatenulatus]KLR74689.1 penicillin-binding protein [Geobacillus sp. T6]OXB88666.1 monofunctional biosynthetic peptidoglycan transglycosylase [Geobacillus thermocatenulatus]RAN31146.1 penicillin-binding protein [Geobacillus sp. A8]